jgi:hypothetical protein
VACRNNSYGLLVDALVSVLLAGALLMVPLD